jgi:threonine/homoserine/homoserine lactone efflux protein
MSPVVDSRLYAFIAVAALLTILPGADMALVTRNVLSVGRRRTMYTIAGISAGCVLHATFSALGLSAILATSATAFYVVKTVGAGYLVWLGIQSIRGSHPERSEGSIVPPESTLPGEKIPRLRLGMTNPFLQGFLTNILNPKVAVFYLTFLPQFIAPGEPVLRRSLMLAAIHIAMGFAWLSAYAWFVDQLGAVLTRPRVKAWLERATGGLLIALGARLAWERR